MSHDRHSRSGWIALSLVLAAPLAAQTLPPVPVPAGNPITADKANLGNVLFWDEQLSSTRTVACGTCHIPGTGGSDPRSQMPGSVHPGRDGVFGTPDDVAGSRGVVGNRPDGSYEPVVSFGLAPQVTGRKTPSMINAAYQRELFWDGRATSTFRDPVSGAVVLQQGAALESQVLEPPLSDVEMAHQGRDWTETAAQIEQSAPLALAASIPAALDSWIGGASYPELFERAFGSRDVTPARIAMAIATYERMLVSNQAPIDRFFAGVPGALTQQQQRGRNIFLNQGRCNICHTQPLFARTGIGGGPQNQIFFNIGVRPANEDLGRFAISGQQGDRGAFKIPSLRNVELRAPFFHNGRMQTLMDVVNFYNRGGDFQQGQTRLIQPLGLSPNQRQDLVAFLRALTDPRVAAQTGPFARPTLYSETGRVPVGYGNGAAGSGGVEPRLIALEPPMVGNPNWTVAIGNALGGAPAALLLGVQPDNTGLTMLGVRIQVNLAFPVVAVGLGTLEGIGAGAGFGSLALALPDDPALAGASLFLQGLVADAGAPQGLAGTAGVDAQLFAAR